MARSVNFDYSEHHMEAALESPMDEEVVHSSFSRLIEEQSHSLVEEDGGVEMEDLADEGRDHLTRLVQPEWAWRGQQGALEPEDSGQTDPLIEERWSSDTLRVLSCMPSRTIGRSRGAIISQYYNRTMQLRRRRQTRPSIRDFSRSARPSIRGFGIEADCGGEESKRDQLVNNLQNLSISDRVRMLRGMPLSVAEKSELRKRACNLKERAASSSGRMPCCSRLKYYIIIAVRQSWYSWLSFLHSLQLWQVALKRVSGRFGTGVLSYFLFLKTLLLFNVFLLLLNGVFLVIPQAVHPPPCPPDAAHFTGLELLTGAGVFTNSVMYYGYYTNSVLSFRCNLTHDAMGPTNQSDCGPEGPGRQLSYNMPLAYFFTIGLAFFITCIILVYSMSKSFGKSFRINKSQGYLAVKVFSSWDFKLIKKTSVKLQSENICTQLKELLSEVSRREEKKSVLQRLARLAVHALAWVMCLGSTLACALAVYYFSEYMHRDLEARARSALKRPQVQEASLLALPVVVSSINLLLPGFFNTVAWMEEYDSPSVRTYVAIFRNLLLKVSVLAVLCFHWLGRIAANPAILGLECWESFVGQELYRFLLMDFIFTVLDTFFGEFLWKLFSQKVLKRKRKPVFDIARNVLELIYGQTLAW
ncbi:transmembrane channel-like protein 6b isoform X2 [Megalops cyprinoides]|nr:transmembrane channel-like protein 6b isoform X2 [Megalops cyprinoides]